MNRNIQHRDAQRGASTVEFALILIPFMITLLSIVEFGRYFLVQHTVSGAAAEGARMAILADATDSEVLSRINLVLVNGGVAQSPSVSVSARTAGQPVVVTVSVPHVFIGILGFFPALSAGVTVTSSSVMQVQP